MSTWAEERTLREVERMPWLRGESRDEYINRVAEILEVPDRMVEQALEQIERYEEEAW